MPNKIENFDWDSVFAGIRRRFEEIKISPQRRKSFLDHVYNLQNWEIGRTDDLSAHASPRFPEQIFIAYAICHADCGREELIVEGGTQECQRCGRLMFRVATSVYNKA